ncbi:TetR/AcrR family transcriptional regulator [Actinomyces sp. oral taxon 170]|jgi:transcriptional regulator|uniref:TetR/AcrR family transcriptional regulator n=1 Tax=Actinomyces sp. oral taxon 170 TaxID=712117 RepID=UPI000205E6A9|nr:helix-turn-helix domain-containing protein [Actinomyces sp. oral taxon 170]EGF49915.1 transcriptional regulator, TetR family [Actinomyces sp. oral taxon 170 str. F0386]
MDQETNRQSVLDTPMSPAASMTADATIAIIAEEGFDRVSVRSVAARLGVAPGTVQYRSPSRRTLLTDALVRSVQRQAGRVVSHETDPADPETLVRALAELLPTGAVQREDAAAWVAFGAAASTRPWLADPYWEALVIMRTWVEGVLAGTRQAGLMRTDLSPAEGARLVTALVNGLALDLLNAPPTEPDEVIGQLRSGLGLVLRGL